MPSFEIDRHEVAALVKDLKAVDPLMRKQLPKRVREAAKPIRDEADSRKPSARIRIGTRFKASGRNGASVKVVATSPKDPPLAGLLELGNKGSRNTGSFRHPVYGRDVWVEQPTQPYLMPALLARKDEAVEAICRVLDDVKRLIAK